MSGALLSGAPAIRVSLHLPLSGAWSAEVEAAADAAPAAGTTVTLQLPGGPALLGRVVRSEHFAQRSRIRLAGGPLDWNAPVALQHYRATTTDVVLASMGVTTDAPTGGALPFWVRQATSIGQNVQAIATHLGVNWRVLPDGRVRMRAEAPIQVAPDAVETMRDATRGIVEIAPEVAVVEPGALVGDDSVGDVIYDVGTEEEPLRCRYYTAQRAVLRGALERLIRWATRDALYLGQYAAVVQRQAADGTLDLLPDDSRLRGNGLQSVPIRHGLPGVEVDVPTGERVLLAFDGGDSRAPYAALWAPGQVTAVRIGGSEAVAMAALVSERLTAIQLAFDGHTHATAALGTPSPPIPFAPPVPPPGFEPATVPIGPLDPVESEVLFTS